MLCFLFSVDSTQERTATWGQISQLLSIASDSHRGKVSGHVV